MKKLSASIYKSFWGWVERRIGLKIERERERGGVHAKILLVDAMCLVEVERVATRGYREVEGDGGRGLRSGGKPRERRRGGEGRGDAQRERERVKRCHAGRERREKVLYTCLHKLSKVCKTKPLVAYKFCFATKSLIIYFPYSSDSKNPTHKNNNK